MTQPLVSIIIPVYNGADYVKSAIESALAQSYKHTEIIVINDGSNDEGATDSICKSFGDRIRYIEKSNGGVSSALNCGIENMRGEYFSWLSHDDLYTPHKISNSIDALLQSKDPDRTILICGTQYINSNNTTVSIVSHSLPKEASGIEMFDYCFLKKKSLNGSALLIPKQAFDECGLFSNLRFSQDMELWGRMMIADYHFVSIPYKGSLIRIHANQATNRLRNVYFEERSKLLHLLYKFTHKYPGNKSSYQKILLKSCYSTYPQPKDLIAEIEAAVQINTFVKMFYTAWGTIHQAVKNIYHTYKSKL